jgi:hypothetical protein
VPGLKTVRAICLAWSSRPDSVSLESSKARRVQGMAVFIELLVKEC